MGSKPTGISGSRAATVLGLNNWGHPFELWIQLMDEISPGWAERNNYALPTWEPSPAASWGLAFEDAIMDHIGVDEPITDREKFFRHKDLDYVSCHVDGIKHFTDGGPTLIEVKTVNPFTFSQEWGDAGTDEIPRHYQCQIQHNLMLTGCPKAELWVLAWPSRVEQFEAAGWIPEQGETGDWAIVKRDDFGKLERAMVKQTFVKMLSDMGYLHKYEIEANTATQSLMLNHYKAFWSEFVDGEKEPPIQRYEDVLKAIKGVVGVSWADDFASQQNSAYNAIGSQIKKLEAQRKELKKTLIEYMRANVEIGTGEEKKLILKDSNGDKLRSYDGRSFR